MVFAVLAESPIEVIDPDTKTLLDVIDREGPVSRQQRLETR